MINVAKHFRFQRQILQSNANFDLAISMEKQEQFEGHIARLTLIIVHTHISKTKQKKSNLIALPSICKESSLFVKSFFSFSSLIFELPISCDLSSVSFVIFKTYKTKFSFQPHGVRGHLPALTFVWFLKQIQITRLPKSNRAF